MVTYEFVTLNDYPIFKTKPGDSTIDMVTVPLELRVPHSQMRSEGVDALQARITTAVEKMVTELNNPESP